MELVCKGSVIEEATPSSFCFMFLCFFWITLKLTITLDQGLKNSIPIFSRPGVAGYFFKTPSVLINYLIQSVILFLLIFKTLSFPNCKSKGADILREYSTPTMWHISHVMCHVSHVTWHMSNVMCHVFYVLFWTK